jgi:hypothetical protein
MTIIDRLLSLFVVPERERLRNLLVPELADLRQQLDQARRLAGEAQRKYRESGLLLLDEIRQKLAMMDERDQLRVDRDRQLAALAEMRESLRAFADSAAKERDALMGEVAKHRARAAELEAERAKANEPRPMITAKRCADVEVLSIDTEEQDKAFEQLDQARRLAGEAQRKYRESGLLLLDEMA